MAHISSAAGACVRPAASPKSVFSPLFLALSLFRSRRSLASLSDHQLADIGLTREEANAEAKRPIWDVPMGWRR